MKQIKRLLPVLLAAALLGSCKKNSRPGDGGTTLPDLEMKAVQISLPAGTGIQLSGARLLSYGTEQPVDGSGRSKVAYVQHNTTVAYLFDPGKKLLLAGFITDSTDVLSPATTADVLLYLGFNIPFRPDTLSVYFHNHIRQLPEAIAWRQEFEALFKADPLILSKKSFVEPLKAKIKEIIGESDPADIKAMKAADLVIDANDTRSGLQPSDEGLSQYKITNWYRRRAHAFLYKMSYRDMDTKYHAVLDKVEKDTKADKNDAVDPVSAVNGFLSEIGKNIEGKGMESIAVTSGPFPLELRENESEAIYKIRIIGPGNSPLEDRVLLSDAEELKLVRLEMETFLLDFVIPAVSMIVSLPDAPVPGIMPDVERAGKSDALLSIVKTMPDVYEEIKKGNYKSAVAKFMENLGKDVAGELLKEVFMIALDREGVVGGVRQFFNERLENLLYILQMADAALGASDLVRISGDISNSRIMEEWDIKARAGQVRLSPKESVLIPSKTQKIAAVIKNMEENGDTHPYFEWSTTGKYGTISDTKGHQGASFNTSDKEVTFKANSSQSALGDGDNLDHVYVTAFIGSKKIGTDTAVVNVKKNKYNITPDGATLSGKEGSNKELSMYLMRADGEYGIQPNADVSYKVIWSTAGKHGKLIGPEGDFATTITTYDSDEMGYECTDKNTKEGTEKVKARIYSKPKNSPESDYALFDETEASIKINNDPKKRIIKAQMQLFHGDTSTGPHRSWPSGSTYYSYTCHKSNGVTFREDTAAVSYSLKFFISGRPVIGAPTSHSWKAKDPSPYAPASYAHPGYANGTYAVIYSWSGRNGPTEGHSGGGPRAGYAEITIYLK